jgi:hypothetical protein
MNRKIYDKYKISGDTLPATILNASTESVKSEVTFWAFSSTIGKN